MPRARQGAKAATGQAYGEAKAQMDAQKEIALPNNPANTPPRMRQQAQTVNPANTPDAFGPSMRADESIMAPPVNTGMMPTGVTPDRAYNISKLLPALLTSASSDFVSPAFRRAVRGMETLAYQVPIEEMP
tara:strand:- start:46 stop:438 length:393 start_codon:yes stop_codon:yes gene_type:complete